MKNYFRSQTTTSAAPSVSTTELTGDEANALCYACGYVARSILHKYETRKGDVCSQYVQCLGDMAVEGEGSDVLLYTRKWLDQVNRGGLSLSMTRHLHFLLRLRSKFVIFCQVM